MAVSSRRTSSGPILRSLSPSGRFCGGHSPSPYSSSSAFASSTSSFSSRSSTFFNNHHRSASPPRVNMYGSSPSATSVRFTLDHHRSISPNRSISVSPRGAAGGNQIVKRTTQKRTCMCSPTNHPGSFRCSLHKGFGSHSSSSSAPYSQNRLNARRSAMTNSLVRIGGVEGDLVKRALSALIRPSSHQQRRRADFRPRPSRLSAMSKADD
uniref:Serine-rich protein-like protein n=1 Tax=Fagus sylvatica TaxID=28930 RepID=A0A2N9FXE1_FAGSY